MYGYANVTGEFIIIHVEYAGLTYDEALGPLSAVLPDTRVAVSVGLIIMQLQIDYPIVHQRRLGCPVERLQLCILSLDLSEFIGGVRRGERNLKTGCIHNVPHVG